MTRVRLVLAGAVVASSAWLVPASHAVPCGPQQEPVCTIVATECRTVLIKVEAVWRLVCTLG